ncbi:MAG: hypothetical protein L6R35_006721 [Caloplaca aegaea]|nr:MAG: hypothetical protein L6R35_006721 [Caloplaca aegaea]
MAPLRIAILECDTGLPKALAKYKRYGAISSALLEAGAKEAAAAAGLLQQQQQQRTTKRELEIRIWDVVNEAGKFPELGDVEGVFLTGSKFDSFADVPWTNSLVAYVRKILAQDRVKLVGVCFGHQIVGRAMGAKVGRNEGGSGWEVSVTDVHLTTEGIKVFDEEGKKKKDVLTIYQMHRDIVFDYPAGVQPLGSTEPCKVQGMFVPGRLFTVQGHPEFTEEILVEILEVRHQEGVFGDEMYKDAMARVGRRHDGVMVGKRFIEFFLGEE